MASQSFDEEAEKCRRQALAYLGRPEAPFLLHIAREFDRLAQGAPRRRRRTDSSGQQRRPG